ncbi:MAG: outer membrane protein assembly factor BamD [Halofilum sp. (in: g-proteobacteria)]|nr:outer membrane protein assembly factor BamD [Halofilum sp. (in: g-proteobacteria)]
MSLPLRATLAAILALALGACSQKDYDPTADWTKERLYDEAKRAMEAADFEQAVEYFEILEARYPFGALALQAQLEIAYGYYKFDEFESAIAACDRFIKLHPTHESVAYAYYLRGLVRYEQGTGFVNNFYPRDMAQMDQGRLRLAFSDFRTIVREHPDSAYADDARKRMTYLRNEMARHELEIARFYFERSAYSATLNRIDYLLRHYDGAPSVPEALELQALAYERLGLPQLAADSRRVLARNWPERIAGGDPVTAESAE